MPVAGNATVRTPREEETSRVWSGFVEELNAWGAEGRVATFWWRDDDATRDGSALRRLLALAEEMEVPLALAVIPATAEANLSPLVEAHDRVSVLQHGFAHANHAAAVDKKCEFTAMRNRTEVAVALSSGRQRLREMFGAHFRPALVPPWNRIASSFVPLLPACGLTGLSTYQARLSPHAAPGVRQTNCHADIVDWRGGRRFLGVVPVLERAVSHLRDRRTGAADPDEPTGLLTHHRDHEPASWAFLRRFLACTQHHPWARWLDADTALWASP